MRIVSVVHDLAAALVLGVPATASIAAVILFDHAPSREVAGQIGQPIFQVVGIATFTMALVLLGCRILLARGEAAGTGRMAAMALVAIIAVVAGAIALWITPALGEIWREGKHAADGTGLEGADRDAFMARHSLGSAGYLVIILSGAGLIGLRAISARR